MQRLLIAATATAIAAAVCSAQTEKWSLELDAPALSPTLYPDAANPDSVLLSTGNRLLRVSNSGKIVLSIEHDRALRTSPTAADLDGDGAHEIVVAHDVGHVFVYEADGALRWSHDFDTPTGPFKHIVAADVHPNPNLEVLIGFDDGWLNCLSAEGALLWRFFGDRYHVGILAVGDATGDGFTDIVYGTDNGNVYCLNGWGHVQWRYWEMAPYGRSGVNIADLDGDGSAEVLLTRSNQGNARCQMALDGKTGAFKWRAPTFMQGYVSNAIADLDGDGKFEVIHADKGNHLTATRADGSRLWDIELNGRGIFWAPAIADVDGDNQLDVIVGVRHNANATEAGLYRVGADGRVLDEMLVGSGANASPAIADLDDDGKLEVLVAANEPDRLVALTWDQGGAVAWPSVRGDSMMRAGTIAMGTPMPSGKRSDVGDLHVNDANGEPTWGRRSFATLWQKTAMPEDGFFSISSTIDRDLVEHRVIPIKPTDKEYTRYETYLAGYAPVDVTVSLHASNGAVRGRKTLRQDLVSPADAYSQRIKHHYDVAAKIGKEIGADLSLMGDSVVRLERQIALLAAAEKRRIPVRDLAAAAAALEDEVEAFRRICAVSEEAWRQRDADPFVVWNDLNPWVDQFSGPDSTDYKNEPIEFHAFRDEFESAAVYIKNISARTIDVRCTFTTPVFDALPDREPDLAQRVTLRRAIRVPKRGGGYVLDALPELDRSGVITLPPGETRQVWITVDTHGLDDGEYELDLFVGSLTHPPVVRNIPIKINVWQVQLPTGVYAQMNWSYVDPVNTSDQDLQSMLDHGVSVANGPGLPLLPVDEHGKPSGEPDWTAFDQTLARLPDYFQLVFHAPLRPHWPAGLDAAAQETAADAAFASGVQALSEHMLSLGWDYDRWALSYIDEPWLTGLTVIPQLRAFCEAVRAADPRVRLYANPTGKVETEYLEEFKDLIDVWQPEINFLKRDPELLAWFHENAKTFWAYDATDPGKELLPLGYYRSLGWLASKLGVSGVGFWVYKYHDLWWPLEVGNWAVVYPSGDEVVPSRRWEACRDGQEDYRALYLLREEIRKARDGHRFEDADRAEKLLNDALNNVAGWQIGLIDEITRQTRDYELDYELLLDYRRQIAEMIIDLRASGAHNPIHFL